MKKLYIIFLIALASGISSCMPGKTKGSNTSFKTSEKNGEIVKSTSIENDSLTLFVEYTGKVDFSADHTAIIQISPGGYLKYRKNDKELTAKTDEDGIQFELSENGREVRTLAERKQLVLEAFEAIKYTDSLRNPIKKDTL